MTVVEPVFIDTNVLIFATIPTSPFHQQAIQSLHSIVQSGAVGWISPQVIREYLVQLSRPGILSIPVSSSILASQIVALLKIYCVADETSKVTEELLKLIRSGWRLESRFTMRTSLPPVSPMEFRGY